MSTRKNAKIKHDVDENSLVRASSFRRTVAWLTLSAYIGHPLVVTAQVIADQNASPDKRPTINSTANGLPLVQISAPNAAGVSHNQYTLFNVDQAGVILNNSQTSVLTQQAGYIGGNANLVNGSARIILNEVTSTNRSQLNGYTEVAGQQAEVIIANPNGITCNGCGFINASRGVLTTGTPVIGSGGSLDAFRVTNGDIQIGQGGMNAGNLSQLDLISRSVQVNGQLWANNLNVVTGSNQVDYNTLGVQLIQGTGNKPTVGIDVALLGGMYANKIRLVGTEAGVGVNSLGDISAQAGDFTLDSRGQISLAGNTTASGNIAISGTGISNSGTMYSQQAVQLSSTGNISNTGLLSAKHNLTLDAVSVNSTGTLGAGIDSNGNATQNGDLVIHSQGQTSATGNNIAGNALSITAGNISLAGGSTNAWNGISLNAVSGNIDLAGAQTQTAVGNILLSAAGSISNDNASLYGVGISTTSAGFSNNAGSIYASGNLGIVSSTGITNTGSLLTQGNLSLNAASLSSSGTLGAGIDANGNATLPGSINVTTQGQAVATGQNVSGGGFSITASTIDLSNSSTSSQSGIALSATAGDINMAGIRAQTAGDILLNATGAITAGPAQIFGNRFTANSAGFSNSGQISVTGPLNVTTSTGGIVNGGTLYSQQMAQLTSTGNINNSGLISAQGNVDLNSASINSSGVLGAGIDANGNAVQNGNINVSTQGQAVISGTNISGGGFSVTGSTINLANSSTNAWNGISFTATGGNIDLSGAGTQTVVGNIALNATGTVVNDHASMRGVGISSTSAGFSNTGGYVYASSNLGITSSAGISNSGVMLAQGNLSLTGTNLDSSGTLGSGIDATGNATQNGNIIISTQGQTVISGHNIAGGGLNIGASNINLAGSRTNAWNGINLTASAGDVNLTGAQTQSVIGNIVLNASGAINNSSGLLYGAQVIGNGATFNNTGGSLGAYGNISLTANSIDNTNGQIGNAFLGGGNITLSTSGNLVNLGGQIGSDQDLAITAGTIVGNGQVIAGRDANISLQGNYTNTSGNVFKANRNLALNTTGSFVNQTLLDAVGNLSVSAASINNQAGATLNSNLTALTATGDITNAGRIEGGTVDTHSANFNNTATVMGDIVNVHATNLNNLNASALIAATQAVNLSVSNALVNQDSATIYSMGDINIGSNVAIDPATGNLAGSSASVTNSSATVEAGGNLRISAGTIANKRTLIGFQLSPAQPGPSVTGTITYTSTYQDDQVIPGATAQSMMLSGGATWLQGNVNNEYSTIAAGTNLTQFGGALSPLSRILNRYETQTGYVITGKCLPGLKCVTSPYNNVVTTQIGSVDAVFTANNRISVTATTVNNQAVSTGAVGGTAASLGAMLGASQGSVAVNAVNNSHGSVAPVAGAASSAPGSVNQPVVGSNTSGNITVPSSGLYTVHSQPGQNYLVATDPRFTNYQNFISSDYMLSQLGLNPQNTEKRLGDGFYEQKLVLDQITTQTGRRYLGQYANANEQYMALLDAGVAAAKDIQLVPGVALTAKQIESLTSDIVWMVDQVAVLPDGSTQHVLAPRVYLTRLHENDLKPNGSLIAADVIDIRTTGSLVNSGTIRAGSLLSVQSQDIINRGGTLGGSGNTFLSATNDILNQSGNISGRHVSLSAGRDIISERLSETLTLGGLNLPQLGVRGLMINPLSLPPVSTTLVHGLAGITATETLDINAGRDVTFAGSSISAGGNTSINAGRDLTIRTVTAQEGASNGFNGYSRTQQFTSSVRTGGNLTLTSGNDMHLTSAMMEVGKDATLIAGGNLILDASKNVSSSNVDVGYYKSRSYDETVLGTSLNAGGNVTLAATRMTTSSGSDGAQNGLTRADGKGNVTLNSASINSSGGNVAVVADGNVNIGVTEEKHESFVERHTSSGGFFTTTNRTERTESARTDSIGSSIGGNNVTIQSGNDLNVTGSRVVANNDVTLAAMNDINITAATNTRFDDHYVHETTTGLQVSNGNITDHGADVTIQNHRDAAIQSESKSLIESRNGNITAVAGNNIIVTGSDLKADARQNNHQEGQDQGGQATTGNGREDFATIDAPVSKGNSRFSGGQQESAPNNGQITLKAGNTVALLAGQDIVNENSSVIVVTDPNFFTKQRHTITDTSSSLTNFGSTLGGDALNVSSGGDIVLQAAKLASGTGGTTLDAARDIQLLAAYDQVSHTHHETLSTDGITFRADGSLNDTATRRMNNTDEGQTSTAQVTSIASQGDITTRSGRDTHIEASTLNAQGAISLNAGTDTTEGTITFAAVKDSNYSNVANSSNSMPWQGMSGHGEQTETLKLANISAGNGLAVNASGSIKVDIPEVPATPAPAAQFDAQGNPVPVVPLTAEQQAAQQQTALEKHIQNLASKPGQEWVGQLAQMAKEKPDSVKFQQVSAAAQHWDYAHEGLTSEAAVVIAIVVAYFTAGAGSSAVGTTTATTAGTTTTAVGGTTLATTTTTAAGATVTTYTAAGMAINAGLSTLASQAAVSFINNKGDIGKTLDDMGKSENVRALVTAMLTAGVMQGLGSTNYMQNLQTGANAPLSASSLLSRLELNLATSTVNTAIGSAVNGTSFTDALGNSLQNAGVDTLATVAANGIGSSYKTDGGLLNGQPILHDLAHAALGCASASAKGQDCGSGALGGMVGEVSAELIGGTSDGSQLTPEQQGRIVFYSQLATAGAAVATGSNLNTALGTSQNAVVNNYLHPKEVEQRVKEQNACKDRQCLAEVEKKYQAISDKNQREAYQEVMDKNAGVMPMAQLLQERDQLASMLSGPTQCSADPTCRTEVTRSLNQIQDVIDAPHDFVVLKATGLALGALLTPSAAMEGLFGRTVNEEVSLFRAVGPAELADVNAVNAFRNLGSAEGKYFTTSADAASSYAKQAVTGFGDAPYTLVETRVSDSIFRGLTPATVDRGIPAWVIPNERLQGLVPKVLDSMPIPH